MKNSLRTKKIIAIILSVTTTFMPLYSIGAPVVDSDDFLSQIGKETQALGRELGQEVLGTSPKVEDGQIIFSSKGPNGQIQYDPNNSFSVQSLYPGTNPDNNNPNLANEYFPDGNAPDLGAISDTHDSDIDMNNMGGRAKDSLWDDAYSETPSISGAAYRVLLDSADLPRPNFENDPALNLTRQTFNDLDLIAEGFGDCTVETSLDKVGRTVRLPDYRTCDRLNKPQGACTIYHEIEIGTEPADIVFLIDNSGSMGRYVADLRNNVSAFAHLIAQGQGDGVRLGGAAIGNSRWASNNYSLTNDIDGFRDWVSRIGERSGQTNPYNALAWAADNYDWREGVHRVLIIVGNDDTGGNISEANRKVSAKGINVYTFHNKATAIGENLDTYFNGPALIKFAQFFTVVTDRWGPDECISDAIASLEEFCGGSYTATPSNEDACVNISGFQVCKGDRIYEKLTDAPIPDVPRLASKVDVSALQCDYNVGEGSCWVDPHGETQCLSNDGEDLNKCAELESDPQCGFISSECVDGAEGTLGTCYVRTETYDCGVDVELESVEKNTEYQCAGSIRCMGADCIEPSQSESQVGDFAKASALLNAAQFMTQDMDCTDVTGQQNMYCTAFNGEAGECKIAVGGVSDCCEKPSNVGMREYLTMVMAVPKLDAAITGLDAANPINSAYQTIRAPVMESWSTVTKPFASHMDNISGAVTDLFSPITEFKNQLMDKLNEQMVQVMQDMLGGVAKDAATQAGAAAATDGAASGAAEQTAAAPASAILGTVMAVYTAYVVAVAIIQMVYACEQEEFEMNAKRATDSCVYVGSYCATEILGACIEKRESYCCFNSPLSRIIQEQVRPQLNQDFGSAENPSCGGIPLDEIGDINWDEVNLDEWLALLQQNGQFPTVDGVSMDTLTGSGSVFDVNGDRLPADQRAMERLNGIDIDAKRRQAMEMVPIIPRSAQ